MLVSTVKTQLLEVEATPSQCGLLGLSAWSSGEALLAGKLDIIGSISPFRISRQLFATARPLFRSAAAPLEQHA